MSVACKPATFQANEQGASPHTARSASDAGKADAGERVGQAGHAGEMQADVAGRTGAGDRASMAGAAEKRESWRVFHASDGQWLADLKAGERARVAQQR